MFLALAAAPMILGGTADVSAQRAFHPAAVASATDTQYPIRSIANGIVVLDVSLDTTGAATGTKVIRDIPSLTSTAVASIKSWKFISASYNGSPQPSRIRVAFAFRPPADFATLPGFKPVLSEVESGSNQEGYAPPGIIAAVYPRYPANAAVPGAVVVQVTVDAAGGASNIRVVRDYYPFTRFAIAAARHWQFQAGTADGKPVTSNLAISFVFAAPLSNN